MKLTHIPGLTTRTCVALLIARRSYYITHDYGTITSFNDSSETLGDVFDIVTGVKDQNPAKHLELRETYSKVSKVMREAVNERRHRDRDGKWAARLVELAREHEGTCTEAVERASCALCYVKRHQHDIEEGKVLRKEEFGCLL